ncbi:MAG: EamA family transporter [Candidatus Altiarchaeota archaeon]|nr:EamA family transporter [Candidatus Altiarchaeota archaeon]
MAELWAAALVLGAALIGSFGSLYFKKAADKLHRSPLAIIKNMDLWIGLFIYGTSTILYIIAIKGGELSVLFPLVSTGYIWVCLLSVKYLGEKMNKTKWAGIAAIVFGVILIGLGS